MQGFIQMSRYAGMREDLVQAGGGNSSFKIAPNRMLIKASGYQLADITEQEGFAVVDPEILRRSFLNCENLDEMTEAESNTVLEQAFVEGKRPSIETFLHAVSGPYTLHTHPIVVNALTCRDGGMDVLKGLFPDALVVPYAKPGVELAKAYFKAYRRECARAEKTFDIVFLQNHGLVVSANTAEDVIEKTERVVSVIADYLHCDDSDYQRSTQIWKLFPNKIVWLVTDAHVRSAYEQFGGTWPHMFCPDSVVFLGKKWLETGRERPLQEELPAFLQEYGEPSLIICEDRMYLIADSVRKAMEAQSVLSFTAQVMLLNRNHSCNLLSEEEQNTLLNWDAEKYRKNLK